MSSPPEYFERIRQSAANRWKQLEADPDLAGPWRMLFRQVQAPRHVVSELLQNADDAGATKIIIKGGKNEFVFKHNGKDFTEKEFSSLCSFGRSSKTTLHTIGFRGIGFKSVFSLGRQVELFTPTLSVAFDKARFTEPKWLGKCKGTGQFTMIRVAIEEEAFGKNLEIVKRNLQEWLKNPISLLFFKNIRQIQIDGNKLHWSNDGPGPVKNTEWLSLHSSDGGRFLIIRSEPEIFPDDAVEEIKEERTANIDEDIDLPPCSIEIVLGVEGCLYTVLPSGVVTELPFACNAPFMQDPSRNKVKDPEASPTNRWLLERAGKLVAGTMLQWLQLSNLNHAERAKAYDLMPDVNREDGSLEGVCGTIVEEAFAEVIWKEEFLLTENGRLVARDKSVIIPRWTFDVWPSMQEATLFEDNRLILSSHVSDQIRNKLVNWEIIKEVDDDDILNILQDKNFPKPETWERLLNLWAYLEPQITSYGFYNKREELCIVPVQGEDVLYAANATGRFDSKKLTGDDWDFLGGGFPFLDLDWLHFLRKKYHVAESNDDQKLIKKLKAADNVLEAISLNKPTEIGRIMNSRAVDFFADDKKTLADSVRIAQIFAKHGVKIDNGFRFVCEDQELRSTEEIILMDIDGDLDLLLSEKWRRRHLLHSIYLKEFKFCTQGEWRQWVLSGRSGLHCFVPPSQDSKDFASQEEIEKELKRRGYEGSFSPGYKKDPWFYISDWVFEEEIWNHWEILAEKDSNLWGKVMEKILAAPQSSWSNFATSEVFANARNGRSKPVIRDNLVPGWILQFREKNCLSDTHGVLRKPTELLRRTPETDALKDIELFVDVHLDNPDTEHLLELLGVGATPTSPQKLLNRIRALAGADEPEIYEVEKWYSRLDQLIASCSTEDFESIKVTFKRERLILTENKRWQTSDSVFLTTNEGDAPGAEIIHASVQSLRLWLKIGVEERPTPELAISWLQNLSSGTLATEDLNRVKALLVRYPRRVWEECQYWLSLSYKWLPSEEFEYALTEQSPVSWERLDQWVKDKTLDLRNLPIEVAQRVPFKPLRLLAICLEKRLNVGGDFGESKQYDWLKQLGRDLQRVILKDQDEMDRIRDLAKKLIDTRWRKASDLEVICYIDGKQAGRPQLVDANWSDKTLYVKDKPLVKLADDIIKVLADPFANKDIAGAIAFCFDRPETIVTEYMEGRFDLAPSREIEGQDSKIQMGWGVQDATINDNDREDSKKLQAFSSNFDEMGEKAINDESDQEAEAVIEPIGKEGDDRNIVDDVSTGLLRKKKSSKPSIMERYALGCRFQKNNNDDFFDGKGHRIIKSIGGLFPWKKISASGKVVCHYWAKDHCLRHAPLEIKSEILNAIQKSPENYALILSDLDGRPVEIKGAKLRKMMDQNSVELHTSAYRLVLKNDGDI